MSDNDTQVKLVKAPGGYAVAINDERVGFVARLPNGWEARLPKGTRVWELEGVWRTRAAAVLHVLRTRTR